MKHSYPENNVYANLSGGYIKAPKDAHKTTFKATVIRTEGDLRLKGASRRK